MRQPSFEIRIIVHNKESLILHIRLETFLHFLRILIRHQAEVYRGARLCGDRVLRLFPDVTGFDAPYVQRRLRYPQQHRLRLTLSSGKPQLLAQLAANVRYLPDCLLFGWGQGTNIVIEARHIHMRIVIPHAA